MRSFFSRHFHSPILRRAAVMLVPLVALAGSSPAFCGEIHDAALDGDLAKVQTLLKVNPNLVFSKDNKGDTPLHAAAFKGHKDVAKLLLANKADVNAMNNDGVTALLFAALFDHKDVAKLLLAHQAEVDAKYPPADAEDRLTDQRFAQSKMLLASAAVNFRWASSPACQRPNWRRAIFPAPSDRSRTSGQVRGSARTT